MIPFDGCAEDSLRYTLRSISENFDYDNVYLVSNKIPDWIRNVIIVPEEDTHKHNKDANLIDKVLAAIYFGMSGNFMFWSDDQIILNKIDPVVTFNNRNPFEIKPQTKWQRRLVRTAQFIYERFGFKLDRNFDTHTPQLMNSELFKKLSMVNYKDDIGYTICTLYFGMNYPLKMVSQEQIKVTIENMNQRKLGFEGKYFLGYNEKMFHAFVRKMLEKRFNKKSVFEK